MKRLIVCCDGTWNTPESRYVTNVVHIARAIKPVAADGTQQVVFYDWGVGTDGKIDSISGGTAGEGIDKNIKDAYRFLVHNYDSGDELWFFGFSRGAYTVRSCIGLLRNSWLLHKAKAGSIGKAYHIYRTKWHADAENAQHFREPNGRPVKIKFLGVWDTVGALGIPLEVFRSLKGDRYLFHDTSISSSIENAYQALAIDERRKPFAPTIWKTKAGRERTEQCWFTGVHSDIGGGYREAGLSHISLQWMVEKSSMLGLDLSQEYLATIYNENNESRLHNSFKFPQSLLGSLKRPIGTTNSDETLHISAENRFFDGDNYRPKNLRTYLEKDEQIRLPL
jgi:uncharacterized protein (DUF2235 family)